MIKYSKQAQKFLMKQEQGVRRWGSIEEVEPDDIDLQMIQQAQSDPDCRTFG